MAQNIYDDPEFLSGYRQLDRQVHGHAGAPEWPATLNLLPDPSGADVADLGCGFGWFSGWAADGGAASVLGLDLSQQMLAEARELNHSPVITYQTANLDELELAKTSVDLFYSSLALHYVVDIGRLFRSLAAAARPGARLVFSVEHPIFSANPSRRFSESPEGRTTWPIENYLIEGQRTSNWFVDGVIKHHRTVGTYVNALIDAGFTIDRVVDWGPTDEEVEANPELAIDRHRPWFLLVGANFLG